MRLVSAQKLGGLSLIVGPLLAFGCFLFQPGGLLINNALMSRGEATVVALAQHQAIANITGMGIALGLILVLSGQIALVRSAQSGDSVEALSQLGLVFLAIGAVGWVLMQGLNLEMSDTRVEDTASFQSAAAVFRVEFGISQISGLAVALGFLLVSVGFATRSEFNRFAAIAIALVSVISLGSQIIGISIPAQTSTMILIARICFVIWGAWSIALGVGMLKRSAAVHSA